MKKTLIAVAVFGAYAGIASAQSSVTLYGVGDAVMERVEGAGTMHRISSGGLNGSRFGLRGVEDLGGGLKAVFQFESGFGIDDGTQSQGIAAASASNVFVPLTQTTSTTRLFGRQAFVGLQTGFGTVRLGRQYTPAGVIADAKIGNKTFDVLTVAGSIFGGSVYTAGTSYRSGGGVAYRTDNAVTYMAPTMGGLNFSAQYSHGLNGADGQSAKGGKHYGVSAGYTAGPIDVNVGYTEFADINYLAAGNQKRRAGLVSGSYDFGFTKLTAYYDSEGRFGTDPLEITGGIAAFPFGSAVVSVGYAKAKNVTGKKGDDADIITLQGIYNLSKRTALYSNYTNIKNKGGAALGVLGPVFNAPAANQDSNGIQIGVRHFF